MKPSLSHVDLYGITSERHSLGRSNETVVREMIDAGIRLIQYREKDKSMKEKYGECLRLREMTRKAGVILIVNDHPDLALAVGADGVHVGQDDLPVDALKRLLGEEMIVGLSTHSPEQADRAVAMGVDYIGVGPIFRTDTKVDVCDPVGIGYLDDVVSRHTIPFVAIGGIKSHNLGQVVSRGATCVAMVTEIVGAGNIGDRVRSLRKVMAAARK